MQSSARLGRYLRIPPVSWWAAPSRHPGRRDQFRLATEFHVVGVDLHAIDRDVHLRAHGLVHDLLNRPILHVPTKKILER
jgi:hypothetical protein